MKCESISLMIGKTREGFNSDGAQHPVELFWEEEHPTDIAEPEYLQGGAKREGCDERNRYAKGNGSNG